MTKHREIWSIRSGCMLYLPTVLRQMTWQAGEDKTMLLRIDGTLVPAAWEENR